LHDVFLRSSSVDELGAQLVQLGADAAIQH
jgi:hypothetical protein